jgi:uncharacterized SAM-binding protein YcdF (DUF218 family)
VPIHMIGTRCLTIKDLLYLSSERGPLLVHLMRRILVPAATAAGVLLFAVTFLPILQPWVLALSAPWAEGGGGTLIVLGGDVIATGIIGINSYWRLVYALFEWRSGHYTEIVVSGGGGLAEAMRDFLVGEGVPSTAIRLENMSADTHENALFVTRMLKGSQGRKVLLTSDYHSLRAWRAFRKCGLDVIPRGIPDAGKRINSFALRWPVFLELVHETVKLAGYRFRGWI